MRARICVCIQSVSKVWKRSNILKKHSILEKNVSDKVVEFKTILKINAMSWLISSYN